MLPAVLCAQNYENSRELTPITGRPTDLVSLALNPPLGLPEMDIPPRNPITHARVKLGRKLFFDRRLSFNRTLSCAMCHIPEQGFTQYEVKTPVGIEGRFVNRNSPSLLNVGYRRVLFHDGREDSLENQVWQPLLKPNEMANPSIGFVLATVRDDAEYVALFRATFPQGLTAETLGMALASYQRGLVAADSPFDRWFFQGDQNALSAAATLGFELFKNKGCSGCHTLGEDHAHFTDDNFHDTGIGYARSMEKSGRLETVRLAPGVTVKPTVTFEMPESNDLGRYEATANSADRWLYRTPTLRNVAITGPYMHDGSLPTLGAVVAYYNAGGVPHGGQDPRIRPLHLTAAQQGQLVAFLQSLTGSTVPALVSDARSERIRDWD